MYGGDEFDRAVEQAKTVMNEVASQLTEQQRKACVQHFVTSSRLEYMFFDGPWRNEQWPC
jgi:thiaminase (transcriptional activator TenA)